MNKFIISSLFAMFALLVSCSSDDNGGGSEPISTNSVFYGNLLFAGSSIDDDTRCSLYTKGDSASITLYDVSFSPMMPPMDIVIPGLECKKVDDIYIISGKEIVPTVSGNPITKYKMSVVDATLAGEKFVLNTVTAMGTIGFSNNYVAPEPVIGDRRYEGTIMSGSFMKDIIVDVAADEKTSTLDIVLRNVKFAENMPLELDVTLKAVPYSYSSGTFTFKGNNIAPYIFSEPEPAPAFTFAVAEGTIYGKSISMTAAMAENLASYLAGKEFVFNGIEIGE